MRLSKKLLSAGVLGYHETTHSLDWDLSTPRASAMQTADPIHQVLNRRERSIKVSKRGWKTLLNVLRQQ